MRGQRGSFLLEFSVFIIVACIVIWIGVDVKRDKMEEAKIMQHREENNILRVSGVDCTTNSGSLPYRCQLTVYINDAGEMMETRFIRVLTPGEEKPPEESSNE